MITAESLISPGISLVIVGVGWLVTVGRRSKTIDELSVRDAARDKRELQMQDRREQEIIAKTEQAAAVKEIREDVRELKALGDRVGTLSGSLDGTQKEIAFQRERLHDSIVPQLVRHENQLADHEDRIRAVETRPTGGHA